MSDEEYSVASPEQKLNISTYFIMSAPVGEVDEVLADVQKLVDDPRTLNEQAITAILRDYNTEHMTAALDMNNKPVLVTKYGQVGNDLYLDPNSTKVLRFDHFKRKFIEETDKKQVLSDRMDDYRNSFQRHIEGYIAEQFKANKCVVSVYGADNGNITICMSAKNVNLGNYWTGSWRSVYTITVLDRSNSELKGNVKTNVHYFEDGNVQLHSTVDHSETLSIGLADPTAKRVVESIAKFETEFQNNLEEMYVNMHRSTFKAMRRFLPVNRQKFMWTSAAHSLASEVSK